MSPIADGPFHGPAGGPVVGPCGAPAWPRTVRVTRYVVPLREGGSLPAVVEADDDGVYVLKFRGAGQGPKALVAEWLAGGLGRALGLAVPELAFAELDAELARTEPDPEIQHLIRASGGLNLAVDYLPGAVGFDPAAMTVDADIASRVVWLDALVGNIDRTARNPNLLMWHGRLRPIDHGAAITFHHRWEGRQVDVPDPGAAFAAIADHVLLPFASAIDAVDDALAARLDDATLRGLVDTVPTSWLVDAATDTDTDVDAGPEAVDATTQAARRRDAYVGWLGRRLQPPRTFARAAAEAHRVLTGGAR